MSPVEGSLGTNTAQLPPGIGFPRASSGLCEFRSFLSVGFALMMVPDAMLG